MLVIGNLIALMASLLMVYTGIVKIKKKNNTLKAINYIYVKLEKNLSILNYIKEL